MGQATARLGLELEAIAATIIGGTSIYGGQGAIWRSIAGVIMLAVINNGFNILNADPFFKDFTTGLIIVAAVAIGASGAEAVSPATRRARIVGASGSAIEEGHYQQRWTCL